MSREDSQFKLRMPSDLREVIEDAAKKQKRSLNAEIVDRLQRSAANEWIREDLIPAETARTFSKNACQSIQHELKDRIFGELNYAIQHGRFSANIEISDLDLASMPDEIQKEIHDTFTEMLSKAGYKFKWDFSTSLWISFE